MPLQAWGALLLAGSGHGAGALSGQSIRGAGGGQPADLDVGYNLLFETAEEEFAGHCCSFSQALPSWADGDFVIPGLGRFEMGGRRFVGYTDAFGKLHRFTLRGGRACATYRMLGSGFWNESRRAGTVAPGLLFYETEPPRSCPVYDPLCNIVAPNDNTFVNTMRLGERLLSLTDSPSMLALDPATLQVLGKHVWSDGLAGKLDYSGSAHPMRHPVTGEWLDFVAAGRLLGKGATVRLFSVGESDPHRRVGLADIEMPSAPYMHSFGITPRFVVLPRMPIEFDAGALVKVALEGKSMSELFVELPLSELGNENGFYLVPLAGGAPLVRPLPVEDRLFFTHVVNAYENGSGVVIDIATSPRNAFSGNMTLRAVTDKASRDAGAAAPRFLVRRFLLPLAEGVPVTSEPVSDPRTSTDFVRVNPLSVGRRHCFYWGVAWFADHKAFASMGVVKYELCGRDHHGAVSASHVWARKNWYPSEPTMIPAPGATAAEDEGLIIFVALDGEHGQTHLFVLDAQTMQPLSEAGPFPRIAFTTHGAFYAAAGFARQEALRRPRIRDSRHG